MNLTKENYKITAAKLYRNPVLVDSEFAQDLLLSNRIVNRMKKFTVTGELKVKLLYNHYKVACNCFGEDYVNKTLFLLSDSTMESLLLTMLYAFNGNDSDIRVNDELYVKFDKVAIIRALVDKIHKDILE